MKTYLQLNPAKKTADLLSYDEMERNTHSSLRMNLFRTFFENTPQLGLQVMMVYTLQQSDVQDYKKTDFAFYQSIVTTSLSMVSGLMKIIAAILKKYVGGDLVIQNMNQQFMKYLNENKRKNITDVYRIDDDIEFYPKMIESLYMFLLQNAKYKQVQFADSVIFKGNVSDCFKAIEFAKSQDQLGQTVRMNFDNINRSEEQILTGLTLRKIFEELIIKDSKIECRSGGKKFIVKQGYEHRYSIGNGIWGFVELVKQNKIEIQQDGVEQIQGDQKCKLYDLIDGINNNYLKGIRQLLQTQVIVINDEIFDWKLFRYLLEIRVVIMCMQFEIKDERVRRIIEQHKQTIQQMKGNIKDDKDYQGYFNMKDQLNGLRVELNRFYLWQLQSILYILQILIIVKIRDHQKDLFIPIYFNMDMW